MGVSASKNKSVTEIFNQTVSNTLNETFISIAQDSVSTMNPTQLITINANASGDVTIDGIQQKVIANIDTNKFISNISKSELESELENSVKTTVDENQEIEQALTIGGAASSNESKLTQLTNTIQNISNSYSYSQFISDVNTILSDQTITLNLKSTTGNVDISNISQFVQIEILTQHIADVLTESFSKNVTAASTETTKITDQSGSSGISSTALIFIAIAIVVSLIVGYVIYSKVKSGGLYDREYNSGIYGGGGDDEDWTTEL
jgi:cobalamin biosynthesis Mg chelatase CobN